tara:strand:+ start:9021 stop:9200 length:180 start_codon:yes stop_codon:yes gene_type:complete
MKGLIMKTVTMVFLNKDASPKNTEVTCDEKSAPRIADWYCSHHSGDSYTLKVDGKKVIS